VRAGVALLAAQLGAAQPADPPPVFVYLHAPDGYAIDVNIAEISSVRDPREGHWLSTVHCVLVMTNKSFITTKEDCQEIEQMISKATSK